MIDMAERVRRASLLEVVYAALDASGVPWLAWPIPDQETPDREWVGRAMHTMAQAKGTTDDEIRAWLRTVDNMALQRAIPETGAGGVR